MTFVHAADWLSIERLVDAECETTGAIAQIEVRWRETPPAVSAQQIERAQCDVLHNKLFLGIMVFVETQPQSSG